MIQEKADTATTTFEPILFCNISTGLLWAKTTPYQELMFLEIIFRQNKFDRKQHLDMIRAKIILSSSVKYN